MWFAAGRNKGITALVFTSRRSFMALSALGSVSLLSSALAHENLVDSLLESDVYSSGEPLFDTEYAAIRSLQDDSPIISSRTLNATKEAARTLQNNLARGLKWPNVPIVSLRLGSRSSALPILRKRLIVSGDLLDYPYGDQDTFDGFVEKAVKRFQLRHGLSMTGIVDQKLLYVMNIPPEIRLSQLQLNIKRMRLLQRGLKRRFVTINIPDASIEVVEDGIVVRRHKAIVGSVERQTPTLSSEIYEINFHPYWHIPISILKKDILPKAQSNPNYLKDKNIRILNDSGHEIPPDEIDWSGKQALRYFFRQDPGLTNAMATAKINFKNHHSVYLHDTPFKSMFGAGDRFHSAGCIRVQGIGWLIRWLLRDHPKWHPDRIANVISSGIRKDAVLKEKVLLHICYFTAWSSKGSLHFRDDVYSRDKLL